MGELDEAKRKWMRELLAIVGGDGASFGGSAGGAVQMAAPLEGSLNPPGGPPAAQGDFVSRQAAKLVSQTKIPSAAEVAERYEAKQKPKPAAAEDDSYPATKFERSKSAVDEEDGRLSAGVEYEKLPSGLNGKLSQQFWGGLGTQQRRTLIETYRRLKQYGVWDYIKAVTGEKEHPERHVKLFGFEFETDGNSGGLTYEATDADGLIKKLKATGHFGEDGKIMGLMHSGQRSNREWSNDPDDPRGAHVSTGRRDNKIDAHIDKESPVGQPSDGKTRVDPSKAWKHGTKELGPEFTRKLARGVPVKPKVSIEENKDGWHGGELKVGVEIELRGPVKKEKDKLSPKPVAPNPADQDVQERIAKRVERTKNIFPIPVGTIPDNVPENKAFATVLAAEMLEAGRNKKTSVQLKMPFYENKQGDQPAALEVIREIGVIVRSELGPQAEKVRLLEVTFGKKQVGRVSLAD